MFYLYYPTILQQVINKNHIWQEMEIFYTYLEERTMQRISTEKAMLLWKKRVNIFRRPGYVKVIPHPKAVGSWTRRSLL